MYGCSNKTEKFTVCDSCNERAQIEKTEFIKKMELDGFIEVKNEKKNLCF